MTYTYTPRGVCSRKITVELSDSGVVENVSFQGGCNGNTQGVAALVKGKKIDDVISSLKGIDCNFKGTSCPDQLAKALEEVKEEL